MSIYKIALYNNTNRGPYKDHWETDLFTRKKLAEYIEQNAVTLPSGQDVKAFLREHKEALVRYKEMYGEVFYFYQKGVRDLPSMRIAEINTDFMWKILPVYSVETVEYYTLSDNNELKVLKIPNTKMCYGKQEVIINGLLSPYSVNTLMGYLKDGCFNPSLIGLPFDGLSEMVPLNEDSFSTVYQEPNWNIDGRDLIYVFMSASSNNWN